MFDNVRHRLLFEGISKELLDIQISYHIELSTYTPIEDKVSLSCVLLMKSLNWHIRWLC